eukprot:9332315-Alexandrium_andersonii.AAC.1
MVDRTALNWASAIIPPSVVGVSSIDPDVAPVEDSVISDLGPRQGPRGVLTAKTTSDVVARTVVAHLSVVGHVHRVGRGQQRLASLRPRQLAVVVPCDQ